MMFLVSNDGIQWTLGFGPDSVTITVKDLDQNKTISSQEIPLAAWQLLLSQRQDFLDIHLPQIKVLAIEVSTRSIVRTVANAII